MNLPGQIAKHLRDVHFGGNWTTSSLKDNLADISWQQATTQLYSCNTIATLVYHINYYVHEVAKVLQGEPLTASDTFSFNVPAIQSEEDWQYLVDKMLADGEKLASLIEQLPEEKLGENFTDEKYGNFYRNLLGIIEHTHYHLGQIALIKKIILHANKY